MEQLPMKQQGGPPTQSRAPQQASGGKKPFPATKAEALQFSNDLLQVLYDERTYPNIVKQLSDVPAESIGNGVGMVAGNLVGNRIADVRGQTGRQIEMKLVVDAIKAVITELGEIAAGEGFFELNPEDRTVAFKTVVQMLDKMGTRSARGGPPQQPGQAGPPQGQQVPTGPPQAQPLPGRM